MSRGPLLLLTGVPRGGTTLATQLMSRVPGTISLVEPIDVTALPLERQRAIEAIGRFASDARDEIRDRGRAPSLLADGCLPDNPFGDDLGADGARVSRVAPGYVAAVPGESHVPLVIKHNAVFLALLPELAALAPVVGIVRNPLSVLASWNSVALPVRDGRMPMAERFDPELAASIDRCEDRLERQVLLLRWCFERLRRLPAAAVCRYEAMVASGGRALWDAAGVEATAVQASSDLASKNASALYDAQEAARWAASLLVHEDAWLPWYAAADLCDVRDALMRRQDRP